MYFEQYDSVKEFQSAMSKAVAHERFCEWGEPSSVSGSTQFTKSRSWDNAQDLMKHGYKKGMEGMMNANVNIKANGQRQTPKFVKSVCGGCPIVPNAIQGLPYSMMNRRKIEAKQRVVDLMYDCSAHVGVEAEDMEMAGKMVLSLVNAIEQSGVRVNLYAILVVKKNGMTAGCGVKIKDAKVKLNPMLVAYPMTHPSFLRRHLFRWIESTDATNTDAFAKGYGCPQTWIEEDAKQYLKNLGLLKDEYYIHMKDAMMSAWNNDSLERLMQKIGIK